MRAAHQGGGQGRRVAFSAPRRCASMLHRSKGQRANRPGTRQRRGATQPCKTGPSWLAMFWRISSGTGTETWFA
jgi:hypothetical protein